MTKQRNCLKKIPGVLEKTRNGSKSGWLVIDKGDYLQKKK